MVFLVLLGLMAGLGFFHHFSLGGLMRVLPAWVYAHRIKPLALFAGMAIVHFIEIAVLAAVMAALSSHVWPDSFSPGFGGGYMDYLFVSTTLFTTLGYADFQLEGPMRVLGAGISLLGFMTLTWSATFLYAMCSRAWHDIAQEKLGQD
ncbi:hypothetical protein AY599_10605 [Leptolyngbya valderiana BDU 20041]|nr:hypothetical protein AY599_10605 [Leptolyngbya valderiana BDU 20041]